MKSISELIGEAAFLDKEKYGVPMNPIPAIIAHVGAEKSKSFKAGAQFATNLMWERICEFLRTEPNFAWGEAWARHVEANKDKILK